MPKVQYIKNIVSKNVSQLLASQIQEITKNLRYIEKDYYENRMKNNLDEDIIPIKTKETSIDYLNDSASSEIQIIEEVAKSRDVEIQNLVKGINDLAVIFKELSVLVIDQGNILDRIDYNIEQPVSHTKKANVELRKSEDYQKSRLRSCICCLIVSIIIMLILVIIKYT